MKIIRNILILSILFGLLTDLAASKEKPLQIYAVDVEGGQATLVVSPSGESLLVDTGWPGLDGRDADRILAATKLAGVTKLDYVIITHYHRDHVGGVPQLAERIPIGTFVDHGPNMQDVKEPREDFAAYLKVADKTHRVIAKPGDTIPIKGINVQVLSSAGEHITEPLPGAGQANSNCGLDPEPVVDVGENARSLGVLITYKNFRFLDLGDLTRRKELEIFCPRNLIGTIDLFLVSHHGWAESNSKAMVWALHPRVAILDNGAREGGNPVSWQIVHDSPGLQGFWQLHYSVAGAKDHNVAEEFLANPDADADPGHYIKVLAKPNGTFTVTNSRNNKSKTYKK